MSTLLPTRFVSALALGLLATLSLTAQHAPRIAVSSAEATLTSGSTYDLEVTGKAFTPSAAIELNGSPISTTYLSPTHLSATLTSAPGRATLRVLDGSTLSNSVSIKTYLLSLAAATRFLDQSSFGPTAATIDHLRTVGFNAYLNDQFNHPASKLNYIPWPLPLVCKPFNNSTPCLESNWWQNAMNGGDQLRQRMAFALSQIFVVSSNTVDGRSIVYYHNTLSNDAFGSFRTLMKDVTLSASMGNYLNMLNSAKAPDGQIANENYARELMQLFTIGINQLNPDGSLVLDGGGNPIPNYSQAQVEAFARVFTGWTYKPLDNSTPYLPNWQPNYQSPLVAVDSAHDTTAKALLGGTVLPSGQTTEDDLNAALENIFEQPSVAPFICRQLIQHLVTSTPSPEYVARISAVFNNDGSGHRGNLQAVARAILLDPEARAGDTDPSFDGGHLREPILWVANYYRGLGFKITDPNNSYFALSELSSTLGQEPYAAPSVFNFFPPSYVIPQTSLNAPEFSLENTATVITKLSYADYMGQNYIGGITVDLSANGPWGQLAQQGPNALLDQLSIVFLHNQMSAEMRSIITNAIAGLPPDQQARLAVFLIVTSSQFKVMH